jgi:hypothetical protein
MQLVNSMTTRKGAALPIDTWGTCEPPRSWNPFSSQIRGETAKTGTAPCNPPLPLPQSHLFVASPVLSSELG